MRAFILVAALASAVGLAASPAARPVALSTSAASLDTKLIVLELADLPSGFVRKSGQYVSNAQARAADKPPKRDYNALGRVDGYSATYWSHRAEIRGGLDLILAHANLYRSAALAHKFFLSVVELTDAEKTLHRLDVGKPLGREARLYTSKFTAGGTTFENYVLGWRAGAVISEISCVGRAGTVDPADVVALGIKQQVRINSATH